MNANQMLPIAPEMILVKGDARRMRSDRPIVLSPGAPREVTSSVITARKMVIACRENARFLRHHMEQYSRWLELPPVIDNVLYLAYEIKIKAHAPFSATALRRYLAATGIETAPAFTFVAGNMPTVSPESADNTTVCLPCHQALSILDLRYMIEIIASFLGECDLKEGAPVNDLSTRQP